MAWLQRWIAKLLEPQSLWIELCVGLGILAFAVLVLVVSRWGQARPLSKCAALSVFAHLLLIGFAYLTRLFDHDPATAMVSRPIQVRLEHGEATSTSERADVKPWQQIPLESPLESELVPLERPTLRVPDEPARLDRMQPSFSTFEPAAVPAASTRRDVAPQELPTALPRQLPEAANVPAPVEPEPSQTQTDSPGATAEVATPQIAERATTGDPAELLASSVTDLRASGTNRGAHSEPVMRPNQTPLPAFYQNRFAAERRAALDQFGGNAETEAAVQRALAFFVRSQAADGRWEANRWEAGKETYRDGYDRQHAGRNADTGLSSLALLSLMGAGSTHLSGEHRESVQHGLEFLIAAQDVSGSLAGNSGHYAAMYSHGMSLLALAEAYALTDDARLRDAIDRGVQYTLDAQHPRSGGWRYGPWQQKPYDLGDMSQFGWQVMALSSARQAGVTIPDVHWTRMRSFVNSCSQGNYGGLSVYQPGQLGRISPSMTAEAMFARHLLDEHHTRQCEEAADYLLRHRPGHGQVDFYLWYYGSLAMFQLQGRAWQQWNDALTEQALPLQRTDGELSGSWDPDAVWGAHGGRIYSTALATLSLEVYYRYRPIAEGAGR